MRVLLFRPAFPSKRSFPVSPDLGLGYLCKVARDAGHEARILDGVLEGTGPEELAEWVVRGAYPVVGFKVYSNILFRLPAYLARLEESAPGTVVVLGGPHPSAVGREIFRDVPGAHLGVAGEGEAGLPALLRALEGCLPRSGDGSGPPVDPGALRSVPGLIYRDGDRVEQNPPGSVEDLDRLGPPPWAAMGVERYLRYVTPVRNAPNVPILTSRGCPYRCSYCAGHFVTGRKVRFRSPGGVVEEMRALHRDHGIRTFAVVDDNFTLRREHVETFCRLLRDAGPRLDWDCLATGVRLDTLDEALLREMERSGCKAMSVAVESGSPRILADMNKQLRLETIREKIALIKRTTRIRVNSYYILGYPEETRQDVEQSIRFARTSGTDFAQFFLFTPLPGTEITQRLIRDGRLRAPDWSSFQYDEPSIPLRDVSLEGLKRLQRKAYLSFYLRPRAFLRVLQSLNSLAALRDLAERTFSMIGTAPGTVFRRALGSGRPYKNTRRRGD